MIHVPPHVPQSSCSLFQIFMINVDQRHNNNPVLKLNYVVNISVIESDTFHSSTNIEIGWFKLYDIKWKLGQNVHFFRSQSNINTFFILENWKIDKNAAYHELIINTVDPKSTIIFGPPHLSHV